MKTVTAIIHPDNIILIFDGSFQWQLSRDEFKRLKSMIAYPDKCPSGVLVKRSLDVDPPKILEV